MELMVECQTERLPESQTKAVRLAESRTEVVRLPESQTVAQQLTEFQFMPVRFVWGTRDET